MKRSDSEASVTSKLADFYDIIQQLNEFTDAALSTLLEVMKSEEIVVQLGIQDDKCKRSAEILDSLSLENRLKTVRQIIRVKISEIEAKSYTAEMVRDGFTAIPDVQWEDVAGLCDIKKEVEYRIIDRFKIPDQYKGSEVESVKAISDIFTRARTHPPCILFLDNIHDYARAMTEGNILLIDELKNDKNKDKVHVLGATNRIDLVDSTLLNLFGLQISVSLPNPNERKLILEALASKKCVVCSINFSDIANKAFILNPSGADLNMLMNEAEMAATQDKSSIITLEHFQEVMQKCPGKWLYLNVDGD